MARTADDRLDAAGKIPMARAKGYEDEACGTCGNFTLARNGTSLKCDTCGSGHDSSPRTIGTPAIVRTDDSGAGKKEYPVLDGLGAIANH